MEYKDYYKVLGVNRAASGDDVKRAYRKLARKYHPDVSKAPGTEDRFKELGEAYEVLKDPKKRLAYDQLGANWKGGPEFNAASGADPGWRSGQARFTAGNGSEHSDFFESLFGRAFRQNKRTQEGQAGDRGEDEHIKILIDIEDSYSGASRTMVVQVAHTDPRGRVVPRERTLNLKIPKGIRPGQQIRLAGQGKPGHGKAPAGDLLIEVEFNAHPWFRLDGRDVHLDLPVAPWEAALGATVLVPTPDGSVDMKIPVGTTAGKKLRLKGRGLPGQGAGDFYVNLQIVLPPPITQKARDLYLEMSRELAFNPREKLGSP
ncbi:MAG: DnaJ C-terminal domain-containing protein [Porticoccaceae bacterium]